MSALKTTAQYTAEDHGKLGTTYKPHNVTVCCDAMGEAIREYFIGFGEWDSPSWNTSNTMNIYHTSCYPEGAATDEMSISFCPFCGAPVECVEVTKPR